MSIIEAGGRGGAITLLVLLAALLLRDARELAAARYAALFAVCVAATLVVFAPALVGDPAPWLAPPRVLAFGDPAVFWVVALALFDDEFTLGWPHLAVWLGLVGLGFWAVYGAAGPRPFLAFNALSLICLGRAVWRVLAGRAGDLVEPRRRLRLIFVVSIAAFIAAIILAVTLLHGGLGHPAYGYANAFGALALAGFFAMALLSLTPGALFEPLPLAQVGRTAPAPAPDTDPPDDPREAALLAALTWQMEDNRAYREETLSIAGLARRLDIPEYRLRRLINQRLGHRNFSAFLNSYRLDEVMAWLADRSQAEVPILTLALDAGFSSIGPFNRAFKSHTGVTPSEYRRRHQPPASETS
ncbi:MAG TPA: helix-turn-helix domain-containing protein [Caulobacteraceae bacterium]|nr:helix-turn-helix domain-containing protein [Caulobacteraceae bacterium]